MISSAGSACTSDAARHAAVQADPCLSPLPCHAVHMRMHAAATHCVSVAHLISSHCLLFQLLVPCCCPCLQGTGATARNSRTKKRTKVQQQACRYAAAYAQQHADMEVLAAACRERLSEVRSPGCRPPRLECWRVHAAMRHQLGRLHPPSIPKGRLKLPRVMVGG